MPNVKPLKIIHVTRQFLPGVGGLENFVKDLASKQIRDGHQVRTVSLDRLFDSPDTPRLPATEVRDGIEIRRVPFMGTKRYPIAPGVLSHLDDADIVHVHAVDFFCDFLAVTRPLHRKRLILTTHGGFFHTSFMQFLKVLYFKTVTRFALTGYDAVVACSAEDARIFRNVRKRGVVEIQNAVDITKFAGASRRTDSTIIYFGRLAPNKGLITTLHWFAQFVAKYPGWKLIIAGRPMGVDIPTLDAEVALLDIVDDVQIVDSPDDAALASLIARSKIFVSASTYEGFGLAAVEAASAGLYPVLSAIPPYRAIVQRLGYGTLIDFTDPQSWSEGDERLVSDLGNFDSNTTNELIHTAVSSFAWQEAAEKYEQTYRQALGQTQRRVGNVKIDVHSRESAAELILRAAQMRKPTMLTFANAHTINVAARYDEMRVALEKSIVLNDGIGVDLASKLLYKKRFPDNLNGTDFVPHLLRRTDAQLSVFVLGSTPEVARKAADHIAQTFPHVTVAGYHHGFFGSDDEADICETIRQSGANIVLVGMGQPRQEIWTARHLECLPAVTICVGALLDFMAGRMKRAPVGWRKMKMEWLFRLTQEPRRLAGRYIVGNAAFLARVVRQRVLGYRV